MNTSILITVGYLFSSLFGQLFFCFPYCEYRMLKFKNKRELGGGAGTGSVSEVLVMYAWGPELDSPAPEYQDYRVGGSRGLCSLLVRRSSLVSGLWFSERLFQ